MVNGITIVGDGDNRVEVTSIGNTGYVLKSVDWDLPSVDIYTYQIPNKVGVSISGLTVGRREPVITGYIYANDIKHTARDTWEEYWASCQQQIKAKKQMLDKIISPYNDVTLIVGDYVMECRPKSYVKYGKEESNNNEVMCMFQITLLAYDAVFKKSGGKTTELAYTDGGFIFELVIPDDQIVFGTIALNTLVTVENEGDNSVGCIIEIYAYEGNVEQPLIRNVVTGEYIKILKTLSQGERIIIDTSAGEESVTIVGSGGTEDGLKYLETGSTFFQVIKGKSVYGFEASSGTASAATVTINFDVQKVNVEEI